MLQDIKSISNNSVIFTPSWTVTNTQPFRAGPVAGQNQLVSELKSTIRLASALKLNVGLYPVFRIPQPYQAWWQTVPNDTNWWEDWFSSYRRLILSYADLANQENVQSLIIGGDWLLPTLPDGKRYDGNEFSVPADAELKWTELIKEIRGRFKGILYWAMPIPDGIHQSPAFIVDVDRIYLLVNHVSTDTRQKTILQITEEFGIFLDEQVLPIQMQFTKPIVMGFYIPSIQASGSNCTAILQAEDACQIQGDADQPFKIRLSSTANVQVQADLYNAIFSVVNTRFVDQRCCCSRALSPGPAA